jgi:hypothetical protein
MNGDNVGTQIATLRKERMVMVISITELRKAWMPSETIPSETSEHYPVDRDPDDNPPEPALALAA